MDYCKENGPPGHQHPVNPYENVVKDLFVYHGTNSKTDPHASSSSGGNSMREINLNRLPSVEHSFERTNFHNTKIKN